MRRRNFSLYASWMDEFRMYQRGEQFNGDEYTSADFIRRMTEREETPAMVAGTAFHKIIQNAGFGALPTEVEQDGWRFVFELDCEVSMPPSREVRLTRDHKGITVVGRVDAMSDSVIHDSKSTEQIDADMYAESYQWRTYLWMSGCRSFVYDLFRVKRYPDTRLMLVQDCIPLRFHAYPGMERDVEKCIEEFDAAVQSLGIPEIAAKKRGEAMNDPANLLAAG